MKKNDNRQQRRWLQICSLALASTVSVGAARVARAADQKPSISLDDPSAVVAPPESPRAVRPWLGLRTTIGRYALGDATFAGYGRDAENRRVERSALGRELGVVAPTVQLIEFVMGARPRNGFAVGGSIGFGWGSGDAAPANPAIASGYDTTKLFVGRFALEPGVVASTGPLSVSLGAAVGFRIIEMPFTDLRPIEGSKKKGGVATTLQGVVAPRATLELTPNVGSAVEWSLAASLTADLFRGGSYTSYTELGIALIVRPRAIPSGHHRAHHL